MLSDVGGLCSSLIRIGMFLIPLFSDYWLNDFLIQNLLYQRKKTVNEDQQQTISQRLKTKLSNRKKAKI